MRLPLLAALAASTLALGLPSTSSFPSNPLSPPASSLEALQFESLPLSELGTNPANLNPRVHPDFHQFQTTAPLAPFRNPPYPIAPWFDINNVTTIAILSQAMVNRMQTWYSAGGFQWITWWQIPVLGMAYTNLDLALGNSGNTLLATNLLTYNAVADYMIDEYIDDQTWWGLFALRGYQAYGNATWLQAARNIAANNTLYVDDTCGGGTLWLTYLPQTKNTVSNTLHFSLLSRLYRLTGEKAYFDEAVEVLNWWLGWAFEPLTGQIHDSIIGPTCYVEGLQSFTYNSGTILFGLADLYYATGNTTLLDLGRSIAYAAMRDYTIAETGVLREKCELDPAPADNLPPGCTQDEITFKGILTLAMAEFYVARPDENIYNFINLQLLSVVGTNIDDTFLAGQWWYEFNSTTAGPKTQINTLCLVAAAATINVDFLAKAGRVSAVTPGQSIAVPTTNAEGAGVTIGHRDGASAAIRSTAISPALYFILLLSIGVVGFSSCS